MLIYKIVKLLKLQLGQIERPNLTYERLQLKAHESCMPEQYNAQKIIY